MVTVAVLLQALCAYTRYELPCNEELVRVSADSAMAQVGTLETHNNSSEKIDAYLSSVGLPPGNPYCAAGQYWSFCVAADVLGLGKSDIPILSSGLANAIYRDAAARGRKSKTKPEINDLVIWRKPGSRHGHIERIFAVGNAGWVETIAFNTSGQNPNGTRCEGVFKKKRNLLARLGNMPVRGLVGFAKPSGAGL